MQTVVPINFADVTANTVDAAIARIIDGDVESTEFASIPTYSSIIAGVAPNGPVNKGTALMDFGGATGFHTGKVLSAILKPGWVNICQHLHTSHEAPIASCGQKRVLLQNLLHVSHNLGTKGDSGTLVVTNDSCPQPVGILVGQNAAQTVDVVEPLDYTLEQLKNVGGYATLTMLSGGPGCTPSQSQLSYYSTPDPDVANALTVRPGLQSWITAHSIPYVLGVAIDMSQSTAVLDVTADDGTASLGSYTTTDAAIVQIDLQTDGLLDPLSPTGMSYDGVPVEVSTVQTVDATGANVDW